MFCPESNLHFELGYNFFVLVIHNRIWIKVCKSSTQLTTLTNEFMIVNVTFSFHFLSSSQFLLHTPVVPYWSVQKIPIGILTDYLKLTNQVNKLSKKKSSQENKLAPCNLCQSYGEQSHPMLSLILHQIHLKLMAAL
jgi:hypothetical protein